MYQLILGGGVKSPKSLFKKISRHPLQGMFRVPIQDFFAKKVFFYLQKNPPPTTKKLNFWPDA